MCEPGEPVRPKAPTQTAACSENSAKESKGAGDDSGNSVVQGQAVSL